MHRLQTAMDCTRRADQLTSDLDDAVEAGNKSYIKTLLSREDVLNELRATCNQITPALGGKQLHAILQTAVRRGKTDVLEVLLRYEPPQDNASSSAIRRSELNREWVELFRWALGNARCKGAILNGISQLDWHTLQKVALSLIHCGANEANTAHDVPMVGQTLLSLLLCNGSKAWNRADTRYYESDVRKWWEVDYRVSRRNKHWHPVYLFDRWWKELNRAVEVYLSCYLLLGYRDGSFQDLDQKLKTVAKFLMRKSLQMLEPKYLTIQLTSQSFELLKLAHCDCQWYLDEIYHIQQAIAIEQEASNKRQGKRGKHYYG